MKRKIEILQQASWILSAKPRKILKANDNEWQVDTALLQQLRQQLRGCHGKRKAATSVQDKQKEKGKGKGKAEAEADMAATCFFPAKPCNKHTNNDACPLNMKPELVASSSSNSCGVPSSVLSSLHMPLNPRNARPHPTRRRSRTRSLALLPDSFCCKGRGEGSCLPGHASHSHCTKYENTSGGVQRCPGLQKNMLLTGGEDCSHQDQCSSCTVLSCRFRRPRSHRLSARVSSNHNRSAVPPPNSGEESSQCDNFCMGHGTVAFLDKIDAATSDAKDTKTTNPNLERIVESPKDLADRGALDSLLFAIKATAEVDTAGVEEAANRGALDLLLFAIQATAEVDAAEVEEASNVPLPESRLIFRSFPIQRKRVVRRARSAFRNCSHSEKETSIRTPTKLRSINDKDDKETPVLRSKCGRALALPKKFCDSDLQPW